jgi:hypothetical protein
MDAALLMRLARHAIEDNFGRSRRRQRRFDPATANGGVPRPISAAVTSDVYAPNDLTFRS